MRFRLASLAVTASLVGLSVSAGCFVLDRADALGSGVVVGRALADGAAVGARFAVDGSPVRNTAAVDGRFSRAGLTPGTTVLRFGRDAQGDGVDELMLSAAL